MRPETINQTCLGVTRSWIQNNCKNGEICTWGSYDIL